jgi:MFS family permease
MFIGLVAGGVLASLDWRAVFWVNVPVGVFGTIWAYRTLRETAHDGGGRIDWWGNLTFAVGLSAMLVAITYVIQPYHGHAMGWTDPVIIGALAVGLLLLAVFALIETRVAAPMFEFSLYRIRAFTAGHLAAFAVSIARGGLQLMPIIWLQGIWLPRHGYSYSQTPLRAGIFLLPLTFGLLISGPTSGYLPDRFGARGIATTGMALFGASFIGRLLLPVDFPYWMFAGISPAFEDGLVIVFAVSAGLSVFAGLASLQRGGRYVDTGEPALSADPGALPDATATSVVQRNPMTPTPASERAEERSSRSAR